MFEGRCLIRDGEELVNRKVLIFFIGKTFFLIGSARGNFPHYNTKLSIQHLYLGEMVNIIVIPVYQGKLWVLTSKYSKCNVCPFVAILALLNSSIFEESFDLAKGPSRTKKYLLHPCWPGLVWLKIRLLGWYSM